MSIATTQLGGVKIATSLMQKAKKAEESIRVSYEIWADVKRTAAEGPKGTSMANLIEAAWRQFRAGTLASESSTAIPRIDLPPKRDQNVTTAPNTGDIPFDPGEFEPEDIEWARRLHRVLHFKDVKVVDAIKGNLESFEKLVIVTERVSELEQHGSTEVSPAREHQSKTAGELSISKVDARSRKAKDHKRHRKGSSSGTG